jgi:hypothetical protein
LYQNIPSIFVREALPAISSLYQRPHNIIYDARDWFLANWRLHVKSWLDGIQRSHYHLV